MNETMNIVIAFVTGVLLGIIFFGGLWWTVQKIVSTKWSAFWMFCSLMLRMSIVLTGFYFIAHDHWERLLVSLFGFIITRYFVMKIRLQHGKPLIVKQGSNYAP